MHNILQSTNVINQKAVKLSGLGLIGIILTVFSFFKFENSMLFIFPLWIFTYIFKEQIQKLMSWLQGSTGFIIVGVFYGMVIEVLAILNNLHLPVSERVLLDGDPIKDLVFGIIYYTFLIMCWYLLLRKISFSKFEIFIITGIFGIFVEETGQVIMRIFEQPITGTLYAILVMFIYGLFPMLTLMITENTFSSGRKKSSWWFYVLAFIALFFQYSVYGNTVYPVLKAVP
jgi:hypothetical protein